MVIAYKDENDLWGIPHKSIKEELDLFKSKTIVWHKLGLELPLKAIPDEMFLKYITGYNENILKEGYSLTVISSEFIPEIKKLKNKVKVITV